MARILHSGVSEQAKAGRHRLEDVRVLLANDRWRGSMYLAGYAVECLLKTKLMQMHGCRNLTELEESLPASIDLFTHQLLQLLRLCQAADRLRQNHELWRQFNIVNRWMPAWRYNPSLASASEADEYFGAIKIIVGWIDVNI